MGYITEIVKAPIVNLPALFEKKKVYPLLAISNLLTLKKYGVLSKVLKGKGIYCWYNQVNHKCYVGSANNLSKRIANYNQKSHILRTTYS